MAQHFDRESWLEYQSPLIEIQEHDLVSIGIAIVDDDDDGSGARPLAKSSARSNSDAARWRRAQPVHGSGNGHAGCARGRSL